MYNRINVQAVRTRSTRSMYRLHVQDLQDKCTGCTYKIYRINVQAVRTRSTGLMYRFTYKIFRINVQDLRMYSQINAQCTRPVHTQYMRVYLRGTCLDCIVSEIR